MLRRRIGDEHFRQFQLALLNEFATRPLSNESLRQTAARFVPAHTPDRDLSNFFDTWIYGTGIPRLNLQAVRRGALNLELSGVEDGFLVEVPLRCKGGTTVWVRAATGSNTVDLPPGVSTCELPSEHDFLYQPAKH
jgi:hypothetical protein